MHLLHAYLHVPELSGSNILTEKSLLFPRSANAVLATQWHRVERNDVFVFK